MDVLADPALRALVDRIVPADDDPGAWAAGAERFLVRTLDRADLARLGAGLAALARTDPQLARATAAEQDRVLRRLLTTASTRPFAEELVTLAVRSFYGDPGNGGNAGAASWSMVGYRTTVDWSGAPERTAATPATIPPAAVRSRYDAIVVGSGAGGGVVAAELAAAGRHVLVVERGGWLPVDQPADHLRNQRSMFGLPTPAGPPLTGNPRVVDDETVGPGDPRWSNNAMTLGGGTRVFGAQAWRFAPTDFQMASTYGVPADSGLADWPIGYADLAPYYDRAEWELGVAGAVGGNSAEGPRTRGYPMPPLSGPAVTAALARGAWRLGWTTGPVPLLINSVPYGGRPACRQCGTCVGFVCRAEAKNGTHNTVLPRALATGHCELLLHTQVTGLPVDSRGQVVGVRLAGGREVQAEQVVLCAGAIETARLLLVSGVGNAHDQVGRHLQGHVYAGAVGIFADPVQDCVGPGPSISTNDFRHGNPGLVGGGMLANEFVPTPLQTYTLLTRLGLLPRWGAAGKSGMRELYGRTAQVMGPVQEVPSPASRVRIAPRCRDAAGMPAARLSGAVHPEDRATAQFLTERAAQWLTASGATRVEPMPAPGGGPSGGQHQAGTCRMGTDPSRSVTDPFGRVWGQRGLRIADASLHVTNGGVNPVLTVLANAYRVAAAMVATT